MNTSVMEKTTEQETLEYRELDKADRADCCGVQAWVRAVKGDYELLFCGHHYAKAEAGMVGKGWLIDDQRSRLNENPNMSVNEE